MINPSAMPRKAVQGALLHLAAFTGIPVIRTQNIQETTFLLVDLFPQSQREELPRQKHIISGIGGIKVNNKQRQKLFLHQNLPGIGTKKALALLYLSAALSI